ncbi:hypothetical protein ACFGVS_24695 [Mucilaginibacter sp. AW1-7]|uniref:hypothetical protein n=1 Tax=Mucilaginibacter sp. AW1-7 TaxID=3349874 RepID=UPI003F741C57
METDIFQPSSDDNSSEELANLVSPFASIGSVIFSYFNSLFQEGIGINTVLDKLTQISTEIQQLKMTILDKLNQTSLKEKTSEVFGFQDSLNDYYATKDENILANIITESAATKRGIILSLQDPDISIEYYFSYINLLSMLQPLRITTLLLDGAKLSSKQINDELSDFLPFKDKGIGTAETIGRDRVIRYQDLKSFGEYKETIFQVLVDGNVEYKNSFSPIAVPPQDLGQITISFEQAYESLANQKAKETSESLRANFDNAKKLFDSLI